VLEIGTGSGYLAACLATQGGRVQSWELHADLAASARTHLNAAGIDNVQVNTGDGLGRGPEDAFDAIVLTGSLPIYQPQFERALKPGGRLFVVVGTGPVMEARLVRRRDPHAYSSTVLFETTLAALEHAPAPPAFRF
jgi:protein-L-isoaspartate(D-aspartate) O-methyltransferase